MLTVGQLMSINPATVTVDTSLCDVLALMKVRKCRQLPVLDSQGKLAGIITDRDVRLMLNSPLVLHERQQQERMLANTTAEACMATNPVTVTPKTPVARAAEMLRVYKFGALPVVEGDKVVGIISVSDLLKQFASPQAEKP